MLLALAAISVLEKHCLSCHALEQLAARPKMVASVTASGYMPPWKPVRGFGSFQGERRLSAQEIAVLQRWDGKLDGEPHASSAVAPMPPPDLTVTMPQPYTVRPDGPDRYRCFVVPLHLAEDRWIRIVDFQPSNRKIVHHALFFTTLKRDLPADYPCFGTPGFVPTSSLGGWSPGNQPLEMPAGTAMRLPKDAHLVIQLHFHPSGKSEEEQSKLNFYFAPGPPTRHIVDVGLVSKAIDIPPGDAAYIVRDHFTLPVDVHAAGIIPHAHYLCRDVKGWATLPGGRRVWLLWIKDWDFDWQDRYWYSRPVPFPAGTRVDMEFTFDNSAANPRNPSSPPVRVTWGAGSKDEMAGLHIQVIPDREEDLPELGKALWGKVMRMVGGRFYEQR